MHIFYKKSFLKNWMWACVDLLKASCRTIEPQICRFEIRGLYIGLIHGKTRDRKSRATLILIKMGYTACSGQ